MLVAAVGLDADKTFAKPSVLATIAAVASHARFGEAGHARRKRDLA
jgi:hypothetical protein